MNIKLILCIAVLPALLGCSSSQTPAPVAGDFTIPYEPGTEVHVKKGASYVNAAGYEKLVKLENRTGVRVLLEHNMGGRILEYSLNGKNVLQYNPALNGVRWKKGMKYFEPSGGRMDIGPDDTIPLRNPGLWKSVWNVEITGPRKGVLFSPVHKPTGVQIRRIVELAEDSSYLKITQVVENISDTTKQYCHWGRSFSPSGGVCVVPLTPDSRFPRKYIMQGSGYTYFLHPEDPHVRISERFAVITGEPSSPKLLFDTYAGWFAYLTPDNLLFVKRFKTDRSRFYNEPSSSPVCIWYHSTAVELEPIGPAETIKPGESFSYTEHWWVFAYTPEPSVSADLPLTPERVAEFVNRHTRL